MWALHVQNGLMPKNGLELEALRSRETGVTKRRAVSACVSLFCSFCEVSSVSMFLMRPFQRMAGAVS